MNVLVTGASQGIGATVAEHLVVAGHRVVLMARSREDLAAVGARLGGPPNALAAPGDVGHPEACRAAVDLAVAELGGLNGVVNAAGTWVEAPLIEATHDDIDRFVRTDVDGALHVTRAALPALRDAADGGRLVHLNGLQGWIRTRPPVLYTAVESAVRGLCESLRWEAATYGVHVTLVTLGAVANEEPPDIAVAALSEDGQRRRLTRAEAAEAVLFCLTRPPGANVDELVLTPLGNRL